MTLPAVGASVCASGSQVCSGTTGSFTANATKKPSMSQDAVVGLIGVPDSCDVVEGVDAGRATVHDIQRHDRDQHQQAADLREQEELDGRVDAALVPPDPDEEVHRDEHQLPEEVEQEEIEREEHADDAGEHPHQAEVEEADALRDLGPRRDHRDDAEERGEQRPAAG